MTDSYHHHKALLFRANWEITLSFCIPSILGGSNI